MADRVRPAPIDERTDRYFLRDANTRTAMPETFSRNSRDGTINIQVNGWAYPCLGLPNGMLCLEDGTEVPPEDYDIDWGVRRR